VLFLALRHVSEGGACGFFDAAAPLAVAKTWPGQLESTRSGKRQRVEKRGEEDLMAQYEADSPRVSGWAIGGLTFAASMLFLIGAFQVIAGLAAIINDEFFVIGRNYTFDLDVSAWGWIHLILGGLLLFAGWGLYAMRTWAVITALVLAMLSAIDNFFFIPYYPWWSLLIIALDIWVIWSLTRAEVMRAA
jgi:hypothetical protein